MLLTIDKTSSILVVTFCLLIRYYCCLFLARMRSAPLIKLERDTCAAIDELIDLFLDSHVPDEMSKWEEEMSAIWMTIIPLVHLAFAAGKEYYLSCYCNDQDENQIKDQKHGNNYVHGMQVLPKSMEDATSLLSENKGGVVAGQENQFLWPGSTSTQKLGVFSLVHTLSIKENLQIALSEDLLPYLVCLCWHLNSDEKENLSACLANFHNVSVPSLKITAKSTLATVYGFDMVSNL